MITWWQAILLGIIEGITEFLPISSTAHVTIAEKLMGLPINDPSVTAFTVIIQLGAIAAAIIYFWRDIWRVLTAWWSGLWGRAARRNRDYWYGWAIIVGSLPIMVIGFVGSDYIETTLRSLWFVAIALLAWSLVMWLADRVARARAQQRDEASVTWRDTLLIGLGQCIALIPGVSRSGATMSVGLLRGFDRVTATRLSFFLGIPALATAAVYQALRQAPQITAGVGWGATGLAILTALVVGYLSIAWLLKFIANNNFGLFIGYRVALGVTILALLVGGVISDT